MKKILLEKINESKAKGITLKEIARICEISYFSLLDWINKSRNGNLEIAEKLASYYQLTLTEVENAIEGYKHSLLALNNEIIRDINRKGKEGLNIDLSEDCICIEFINGVGDIAYAEIDSIYYSDTLKCVSVAPQTDELELINFVQTGTYIYNTSDLLTILSVILRKV